MVVLYAGVALRLTAAEAIRPKWIWHADGVPVDKRPGYVEACFRRTVTIPARARVKRARLVLTADAQVCRVYINGTSLGDRRGDWRNVWGVRLGEHLEPGTNVLAAVASKPSGSAGLIGRLTVSFTSAPPLVILTDQQWRVLTKRRSSGSRPPPVAIPEVGPSLDSLPLGDELDLELEDPSVKRGSAPAQRAPREPSPQRAEPDWTSREWDDRSWSAARELGPLGMPPWGDLALVPSPQPVAWPTAPATRPLTRVQADALLEADWLQQVHDTPLLRHVREEIEASRRLARRLGSHPERPTFDRELAEIDLLAPKADAIVQEWTAEAEIAEMYLAARRIKRRIMFRNPILDFDRLLLIDGSPPSGHESGHRNTYGGDLRRIGSNRILVLDALDPGANARDVVPGQAGGVMRMDLAFDASRLVYSMVAAGEDSFHLYEARLGPEGVSDAPPRQLTRSPYHDMDPIYLPDGKIAFCTTRGNTYVRCLPNSPCTVLARCDSDGRNIRMISNNNEPDYTPSLLPDGRILYTRWEYTERPLWRLQALWTMNPDGTGVAHYWGNRSYYPDMLWEARPIPGTRKVMFTGVGHHNVSGGPIGIVDTNEGRDFPDGLYKVTAEVGWTEVGDPREGNRAYFPGYRSRSQFKSFTSPYPLSSDDFLVSARGSGRGASYYLYLMDVAGNRELVYAGTGQGGVWCAMPLRPRPRPPAIPDRVRWPAAGEKAHDGIFYSANVLDGVEGLPPGKAKFLRVLQQDHKTYSMGYKSFRHSGPIISALQEDAVKRILGTVRIRPDGSVCFRVPAGAAVYFQLLDENQRCLQVMRSFTGVMPGEIRGCTGCHEAHGTAMPPVRARGASYQAVELTPPPWGADVSISYERFAQPVLDKHCGKCHQGEGKGRAALDLTLRGGLPERGINDPQLLPFKEPYLTLVGDTAWVNYNNKAKQGKGYGLAGALPVEAGGSQDYGPIKPMSSLSYTSPLIERAMSGKHHNVKIQGEDLLRLIAWVDCNCVYRGEEEVRQIPDPDESSFGGWTVPPKTRTAPVIDRLQAVTDPVVAHVDRGK